MRAWPGPPAPGAVRSQPVQLRPSAVQPPGTDRSRATDRRALAAGVAVVGVVHACAGAEGARVVADAAQQLVPVVTGNSRCGPAGRPTAEDVVAVLAVDAVASV